MFETNESNPEPELNLSDSDTNSETDTQNVEHSEEIAPDFFIKNNEFAICKLCRIREVKSKPNSNLIRHRKTRHHKMEYKRYKSEPYLYKFTQDTDYSYFSNHIRDTKIQECEYLFNF